MTNIKTLTAMLVKAIIISVLSYYPVNLFAQCGPDPLNKVSLGGNLNGLSDWNRDRPFNDVFKMNRGFSNNPGAPWSGTIPELDEQGWPLQDFGVIVMVGMDSTMGGTYKIRFNGQATLDPVASGFTVQNVVFDAENNLTTADLTYQNTINNNEQMMISFTNTLYATGIAGVKNIKIMKPGIPFDGPTFDQRFLDHISRFSNLRMMDWHSTNANQDSLWSDRTLPDSPSQAGEMFGPHGIAWEYCIELANLLKKDLWINIPHKATDDYVLQLATLLHNSIDTSIHVYVEYSNEVWNWSFQQAQWNLTQANIEATQPGNPLNYDNVNDQYIWHYRRIANRGKEISDIFKNVFGAAEINKRIRVVYAVQVGWFDVGQRGIEFINNYYGAPKQFFYGLAVAPYFNTSAIDGDNTATKDEVLTALQNDVVNIFSMYGNWIMQYAAITHYYDLVYMCYEGGPDTFGPNNIEAKKAATKDPQMKTICTDYLNRWFMFGAEGQFNWFTAGAGGWDSQYGTWSLTEYFENSYKLQALDEVLATTPPELTAGFEIPGNIDARLYAGYPSDWNSHEHLYPTAWHGYDEYLIRVPVGKAGLYGFTIGLASTISGQTLGVYLDNQLLSNVTVPNTGSNSVFEQSPEMTTELIEGLHTLRFKWASANYVIDSLRFSLITPCIPSGISDYGSELDFSVYPNPTNGNFVVDCAGKQQTKLEIFNILGTCIQSQIMHDHINEIDIHKLPQGVYIIRLSSNVQTLQKTLIKR